MPFAGTVKVVLTLKFKRFDENQLNSIMQSKLHFLISLDTLDNAAVDLALWLLVLVVLLYRLHDRLFYRLQKNGQRTFDECSARTD